MPSALEDGTSDPNRKYIFLISDKTGAPATRGPVSHPHSRRRPPPAPPAPRAGFTASHIMSAVLYQFEAEHATIQVPPPPPPPRARARLNLLVVWRGRGGGGESTSDGRDGSGDRSSESGWRVSDSDRNRGGQSSARRVLASSCGSQAGRSDA